MSIKRRIFNCFMTSLQYYLCRRGEIKKFQDPRRVEIYSKVNLSEEQKNEIDSFYLKFYGAKVPYTWHRHFYAMTGKFDKKYFPELLFIPEYESLMNSDKYTYALADKNITQLLFNNNIVKMPKVKFSCANGIMRDQNLRIINKEKAASILNDIGKCFIKPTVDSCSGQGCQLLDCHNGKDVISDKKVLNIIDNIGTDFVVQECIQCHKSVKDLHPESVNTFRVISYIAPSGEIHHTPVIMRIGRGKNFLDNAHAGGIFIGISDDGDLLDYATTEFNDKFYIHPDSNVKFKGYKIPLVRKVIEKSKELHAMIPQIGCINFDFTINEDGDVVLIELNLNGGSIWLPQMAWGKGAFGDDTEDILLFLKSKRGKFPFRF